MSRSSSLLFIVPALSACGASGEIQPAERPNIVLVVLDTLRLDRLSTYGYEHPTSPTLDELAREGVLFEAAYTAASYTWPSTASLLTGLLPQEHGVIGKEACRLPDALETLAEALQRVGYTTAAWSGNPLVTPYHNFGQGFDEFDRGSRFRKTGDFIESMTSWIEGHAAEPFFLYAQLVDTHWPYQPLAEARRFAENAPEDAAALPFLEAKKQLRRGLGHTPSGERVTERVVSADDQRLYSELYDACVWSADRYVRRLVEALDGAGVRDRTVIAVTSDHGEELFDRGLMGHGHSLYPEMIRAPLILTGPGIPAGSRVAAAVSNRHLAPTLARVGGADFPGPDDPLDLVRVARGDARVDETILFSTAHGFWNGARGMRLVGLRQGDRLLQAAPEGAPWGGERSPGGDEWSVRLFDVARDPLHTDDLAAREPETAARLTRLLREHLEGLHLRAVESDGSADADTLELLKRIGYIGD